jgi:hypothetical protein
MGTSRNLRITGGKMSTLEVCGAIRSESERLRVLYLRARRRCLGEKRGKRPGPLPEKRTFIVEARARLFERVSLSPNERRKVDDELEVMFFECSRILDGWRKSYPYRQMCWQENWDNLREAQRIGRMIVRAGRLSWSAIQKNRGLTKRRLEEITPLILGWNPSLELHVRGNRKFFKALPKGSPELAARISEINRKAEEYGQAQIIEHNRRVEELIRKKSGIRGS